MYFDMGFLFFTLKRNNMNLDDSMFTFVKNLDNTYTATCTVAIFKDVVSGFKKCILNNIIEPYSSNPNGIILTDNYNYGTTVAGIMFIKIIDEFSFTITNRNLLGEIIDFEFTSMLATFKII